MSPLILGAEVSSEVSHMVRFLPPELIGPLRAWVVLNKVRRIIVSSVCGYGFNNTLRINYDSYSTRYLNDLTKVLCSLTGSNYDDIKDIYIHQQNNIPELETNTWYDWGFFEFKVFKLELTSNQMPIAPAAVVVTLFDDTSELEAPVVR